MFQSFCSWISTLYALTKAGFLMVQRVVVEIIFVVNFLVLNVCIDWVMFPYILVMFLFLDCRYISHFVHGFLHILCSWGKQEFDIAACGTCWFCRKFIVQLMWAIWGFLWRCFCLKNLDVYKITIPTRERESTLTGAGC